MSCEAEELEEKATASAPSSNTNSIVFEASTQTPTNEQCDSPLFSQKGYCLKTSGHSNSALINIHKMRQNDQVNRREPSRFACKDTKHKLRYCMTINLLSPLIIGYPSIKT